MALVDNAWYVNFGNGSSTGYYAVTAWSNHTAVAGELIRQLTAPAVGSERVFVCTTAGATGAVEPTWVNTRGALNTSSVAVYQECTGIAALNGDATNTPTWTITATPPGGVKNTAVTLGQVIKRNNGASYQICTVAGTAGNGAEPAFSDTAGTTTADNTATWTSLGVVGNFTGWQAPHARLASSFASTWGQAGNSFYVGDNHAETQATSLSATAPSSAAAPCPIYCVNHSGSLPPVSADLRTTATITTTTSGNITLASGNGISYSYGITFSCGSGANTPVLSTTSWNFEACALSLPVTSSSSMRATTCVLNNTTVSFGAIGHSLLVAGRFVWKNTASAIVGATIPTTLINALNPGNIVLQGVDLSAAGSGKTIIAALGQSEDIYLVDCKLGASVTVAATQTGQVLGRVFVIHADSAATNYVEQFYTYMGTQLPETTIVRTGGASDGTTTISRKITTTANSKWQFPFESSIPIAIWNDSTSAITTLTIYGTTTGGGVPNNDDIWVEVEYLGSALTPQGSFITTTKTDNLAASAATNNSSDASTWGGGGAGNGFKIVVPSFTPGMKGPINITIKVAKASSTYYIDPRPSISAVTVSKSEILAPGVYANEISSGTGGGISRARGFGGFS